MKKKIVSILLILALIIGYAPVITVQAISKPVKLIITPDRTNAQGNDQIVYTVSLQVNEPITTIQLDFKVPDGLTYDAKSAALNEDFVDNLGRGVSELSVTERGYTYDYNTEEGENVANSSSFTANEIKIIISSAKNLNILPGKVTTGTVEIATFSATVNEGAAA